VTFLIELHNKILFEIFHLGIFHFTGSLRFEFLQTPIGSRAIQTPPASDIDCRLVARGLDPASGGDRRRRGRCVAHARNLEVLPSTKYFTNPQYGSIFLGIIDKRDSCCPNTRE